MLWPLIAGDFFKMMNPLISTIESIEVRYNLLVFFCKLINSNLCFSFLPHRSGVSPPSQKTQLSPSEGYVCVELVINYVNHERQHMTPLQIHISMVCIINLSQASTFKPNFECYCSTYLYYKCIMFFFALVIQLIRGMVMLFIATKMLSLRGQLNTKLHIYM